MEEINTYNINENMHRIFGLRICLSAWVARTENDAHDILGLSRLFKVMSRGKCVPTEIQGYACACIFDIFEKIQVR